MLLFPETDPSTCQLPNEHNYCLVPIPATEPVEVDDPEGEEEEEDMRQDEFLPEDEFMTEDAFDVSFHSDVESSCHECSKKDDTIKELKDEMDKLKKELTVHRREREKQRARLASIDAGQSFFRDDQLKFLKNNNLRGYTWSKETLRDALKIRFSGKNLKRNT